MNDLNKKLDILKRITDRQRKEQALVKWLADGKAPAGTFVVTQDGLERGG